MLSIITRVFAILFCLSVVAPAHATLFSRLGGAAAYDDIADITWVTTGDLSGGGTWDVQVDWAAGFSLGGFDDWRLATIDELGHMYHNNMGGSGDNTGNQTLDGADFTNIKSW